MTSNYSNHPSTTQAFTQRLRLKSFPIISDNLIIMSEDLIGLALFDNRFCLSTLVSLQLIVKAMPKAEGVQEPLKRAVINLKNLKDKKIEDFVTNRSAMLMKSCKCQAVFSKSTQKCGKSTMTSLHHYRLSRL